MDKVKNNSKKILRQRDCDRLLVLLELLRTRHDHPDAQECHTLIQKIIPKIGLSTVYRHLATLVDNGLIHEIKSDDGPARYDATTQNHGHFLCTTCHQMTDLIPVSISTHYPGTVDSMIFLAKGTCQSCLKNLKN